MNLLSGRFFIAGLVVAGLGTWALAEIPGALAQDLPKAAKRENVIYYEASFTKFKPGRASEGQRIIGQHFIPVDKAIGRDVQAFDMQTGHWEHVVFFPLAEGVAEWGWRTSNTDEKWWAAFAEREGGADKAMAVMKKFRDTIASSQKQLAHRHLGAAAK